MFIRVCNRLIYTPTNVLLITVEDGRISALLWFRYAIPAELCYTRLGRILRGKHCADFPQSCCHNISRFGVLNKSVVGSFNQWLGGISKERKLIARTFDAFIRWSSTRGEEVTTYFFLQKKSVTFSVARRLSGRQQWEAQRKNNNNGNRNYLLSVTFV